MATGCYSIDEAAFVKYEGEKYSLMEVPPVNSPLVVAERNRLFGDIDLEALDLLRACEFVRIAHNHPGIARNEILIFIKRIGDEVAGLRDKAATAVKNLSRTLHRMLLDLQSVYKHLLDGKEEIAVDTLRAASKLVASGGKAAEELSKMFETEEERIEGIIKQTIKKKGEEQKHEARTWTQSIEGLHNAIGTLKYLTVTLLQSADFWKKLQVHCKLIVDMKMDWRVEIVLPKPQETRVRLWAMSEFKQAIIIFFVRCVSLKDVSTTYSNLITGEISTPRCDALEDMCTMYSEMVKDKVSTPHTSKVDTLGVRDRQHEPSGSSRSEVGGTGAGPAFPRIAGDSSEPCTSEPKIFDEKPTDKTLTLLKWNDGGEEKKLKVTEEISGEWRKIGKLLGISAQRLDGWWDQSRDNERCCDKVVGKWLQNPPDEYPATWHGLLVLLEDADFTDLAKTLKKALENKV